MRLFFSYGAIIAQVTGKRLGTYSLLFAQIINLRCRVALIRNMQPFGVGSFFDCALGTLALFTGYMLAGYYIFGFSLISLREVQVSADAPKVRLSNLEQQQE